MKKSIKEISEFIKNSSKTVSNSEAIYLAYKVLNLSKKVSKGLITEAEALASLKSTANVVMIAEAVSIAASILIWIINKAEEGSKKRAEKRRESDNANDIDTETSGQATNDNEPTPEPAMS